jgi:hypothetical protein
VPLSWLLYEPLGGWETLPRNLFERSIFSSNSIANIAYWLLRQVGGWERFVAQGTVARIAPLAFALLAGVWLWRWWRTKQTNDAELWRACAVIATLYFIVGSYWFQHWYVLWLVALVAVLPQTRWAGRWLPLYVLGAMLAAHTLDFLNSYRPGPLLAPLPASVLYVVILFAPLVLARLLLRNAVNVAPAQQNLAGVDLHNFVDGE